MLRRSDITQNRDVHTSGRASLQCTDARGEAHPTEFTRSEHELEQREISQNSGMQIHDGCDDQIRSCVIGDNRKFFQWARSDSVVLPELLVFVLKMGNELFAPHWREFRGLWWIMARCCRLSISAQYDAVRRKNCVVVLCRALLCCVVERRSFRCVVRCTESSAGNGRHRIGWSRGRMRPRKRRRAGEGRRETALPDERTGLRLRPFGIFAKALFSLRLHRAHVDFYIMTVVWG